MMFRIVLLVGAMLLASTANAQRVFRASAVDIEQDERIDGIDARIERIEASVDLLATAVAAKAEKKPEPVPPVTAPPAAVKPEPASAKVETVVTIQKPPQPTIQKSTPSNYYSQAELVSIVQRAYPDRNWTKYADVQPRSAVWSHLQDGNHRFTSAQVSGLPQDIALGLHGLHHKNLIRPERNTARTSAPIAKAQPASVPQQTFTSQPVYQSSSGCANGQCARQPVVYRSGCANGQCANQSPQVRSTRFRLFQRR